MVFKLTLLLAGIAILSALLVHYWDKQKPTPVEVIEEQITEEQVVEEQPTIAPVVIEVKVAKEEPVKKKRKPAPKKVKK